MDAVDLKLSQPLQDVCSALWNGLGSLWQLFTANSVLWIFKVRCTKR